MKKRTLLIILLLILALTLPAAAQAGGQAGIKSKSRTKMDFVKITRITPRTFSHLLKPVKMPVHLEVEYELKSKPAGKLVFKCFRYTKGGKIAEIKALKKSVPVKKGKETKRMVTKPLVLPPNDDTLYVYMVASLVSNKKELAFSSSKNFIAGSYRLYPEKGAPERDFIRRIGIQPRIGSDVDTNKATTFNITLNYSIMSKKYGYVDVLFQDLTDLGTPKAWKIATIAIPKGKGKISLKPSMFFENALAGKNMGITILLWLKPIDNTADAIRISEYFLRRSR